MEINIAFIKDIISNDNTTNLNKYERIVLAFSSLIEEVILFMGIYYFVFSCGICDAIIYGLHSLILHMVSICKSGFLCKVVSIYQVFCSIILITISFASYIGNNKDKKEK